MPNQSGDSAKFVNDNYRKGYEDIFGKKGVTISFPDKKTEKNSNERLKKKDNEAKKSQK